MRQMLLIPTPFPTDRPSHVRWPLLLLAVFTVPFLCEESLSQAPLPQAKGAQTSSVVSLEGQPVVARIEMKLVDKDDVIDVIEKGDLLTVLQERDADYVILTHDGTKGAVEKANAVRVSEAVQIYTELIEQHPEEGRFFTLRASSWWALGKANEALKDFDRAIDLGYTESHAYASRGLFHATAKNYDQAIKDYNKALEVDPEDTSPLINRAAVHLAKSEYQAAIDDYTQAMKADLENTGLLHQRAIAFKAAGQLDEAIKDFTAILEIEPKDVRAVMGRGYIFFRQEKHEMAVDDFSDALELNPKDPVAWNNRGYNRFQIKQYEGALKDYAKAIELAPKYDLALQNLAWALATCPVESLRDPKRAIKTAEAACKLSNYDAVGDLSALAAAFASNGKFETAVGWQEKVVERVGEQYKDFARKTLERYQRERPFAFDPDQANQREAKAAEDLAVTEAEKENAATRADAAAKLAAEEAKASSTED